MITFVRPQPHRVVYIGRLGNAILKRYINEPDSIVYPPPNEIINIWVLFYAFVRGWWSRLGYFGAFLRLTRPKFVVTLEDNALEFYFVKRYLPSAKTICLQNGRRAHFSDLPGKSMWRYIRDELSAGDTPNVILAHGIPASIFYREVVGHGSTQIISAGNLRNNAYCGQSNRQDRRLLFVSSFPNLGPNGSLEAVSSRLMGYWAGVPITVAKFYRVESVVARIVGEYAERLNLPFGVVGKRPSWQTGEFQYFQDALKGLRWSYFPSDTDDASYSAISDADVLVNVDSTFGYEMMARGVRVAFVTARMPLAGHPEIRDCDFAYPFITSPRGPFWTNDVSQSEIFRVINAVIARPNSEWCTAAGIVTKEIFNYDRGNSILCKVLDELGIQNSGPQFLG